MIDVNSKIMADMKNGSSNMDQAIATAIEYARLGYKKVVSASEISTNGRVLTSDEKQLLIDRINDELDYQKIDFQVLSGNLMSCDPKMMEYFQNDLISSINYSRYILLELPSTTEYKDLNKFIYDIQIKGYVPIIVHPERCKYVQENPDYLISLKERDCLVQLDMSSVVSLNLAGCSRLLRSCWTDKWWMLWLRNLKMHMRQNILEMGLNLFIRL